MYELKLIPFKAKRWPRPTAMAVNVACAEAHNLAFPAELMRRRSLAGGWRVGGGHLWEVAGAGSYLELAVALLFGFDVHLAIAAEGGRLGGAVGDCVLGPDVR